MSHRGRKDADSLLAGFLAAGNTVLDTAKAAGVSPRSVHRRLKDPAFRAAVAELRSQAVQVALGKLTTAMSRAADTLIELLADGSPDMRFKSAGKILETAIKLRDTVELEGRLAQVEQRLAAPDPAADDEEDDDDEP